MSETLREFAKKVKLAIDKALELSSVEYFDDDGQSGVDSYWSTFAYESV